MLEEAQSTYEVTAAVKKKRSKYKGCCAYTLNCSRHSTFAVGCCRNPRAALP